MTEQDIAAGCWYLCPCHDTGQCLRVRAALRRLPPAQRNRPVWEPAGAGCMPIGRGGGGDLRWGAGTARRATLNSELRQPPAMGLEAVVTRRAHRRPSKTDARQRGTQTPGSGEAVGWFLGGPAHRCRRQDAGCPGLWVALHGPSGH